jgi:Fe-S oxidoreductase
MVPYARASVDMLEDLEKSTIGRILVGLGSRLASVYDVSKLTVRVSKEDISAQHDLLKGIARILNNIGISFGYMYDDELYSGVLLYDLGRDEDFRRHAERVSKLFKERGVKRIIAVDPHTTYILREVYPKFVDGFDVEVRNYLEILAEKSPEPKKKISETVTIHDPCYYARYLKIIDQPRNLLVNAGVEIKEPDRTKSLTFCCGGPIESIFPRISKEIASLRVDQLGSVCKNAVVMCPFCFENLSRADSGKVQLRDIAYYLSQSYGGVSI